MVLQATKIVVYTALVSADMKHTYRQEDTVSKWDRLDWYLEESIAQKRHGHASREYGRRFPNVSLLGVAYAVGVLWNRVWQRVS